MGVRQLRGTKRQADAMAGGGDEEKLGEIIIRMREMLSPRLRRNRGNEQQLTRLRNAHVEERINVGEAEEG
jgi:hypothetical protein